MYDHFEKRSTCHGHLLIVILIENPDNEVLHLPSLKSLLIVSNAVSFAFNATNTQKRSKIFEKV
jgi:hypothetical protein